MHHFFCYGCWRRNRHYGGGCINYTTKSIWKRILSCDGLCSKHKLYYIFEPFGFIYFPSETLITWKNTNFTTSKTQIILHFRVTFFFFSPKPWSREKHKFYNILMVTLVTNKFCLKHPSPTWRSPTIAYSL